MASITLKKDKDGNQIFDFDNQFLEIFKQKPELFNEMIDALKDKDLNLKKEEVNLKKQENVQAGIKEISSFASKITEILGSQFVQETEEEALQKCKDLRPDEEVEKDINKNYTFSNDEINIDNLERKLFA